MLTWVAKQSHDRPWLRIVVGAYLSLFTLELVRVSVFARPTIYDAGFYEWEEVSPSDRQAPSRFRWTAEQGLMLRPVEGVVLNVPLLVGHPDPSEGGVPIRLTVNGGEAVQFAGAGNGWYSAQVYLPALLGPESWAKVSAARSKRESEASLSSSGWFATWQELRPWRAESDALVWIEIDTPVTFVPSVWADTSANRLLGIGVAQLEWKDSLPPDGFGFHAWEADVEGRRFRWTRRRAGIPLSPLSEGVAMWLRADHPDIRDVPVEVHVFWGAELVRTVTLTAPVWTEVVIPASALTGDEAVLSFAVDRTWSPAQSGTSPDARDLGVALSEIARR